jgi:hypothetical protein
MVSLVKPFLAGTSEHLYARYVPRSRTTRLTADAQAAARAYRRAAQAYGRALSLAFKQHAEQFREWGATGGKTRARNLTAEERRAIARKAARARWGNPKKAG